MAETVFTNVGEVNLRDPAEKEFKRIADRLRRVAKARFNRAIAVEFVVDSDSDFQQVSLAVELEEEVIDDGQAEEDENTASSESSSEEAEGASED